VCCLHWIVDDDDCVGAEGGLVVKVVFEEVGAGIGVEYGSEVDGFVPSDAVVVDVDFTEHLHHFELESVSVEVGGFVIVIGGGGWGVGFVGFAWVLSCFGEGEGVGDFEDSVVDC